MKRKTVAALTAPKRVVASLTVWAMALTWAMASVVFLPSSASAAAPTEGLYVSVARFRLLDTRLGVGSDKGPVAANGTVHLQVTDRGGVPASVSAVVLMVTVTAPATKGSVSVYAYGATPSVTANLSFTKAQTVSKLVITRVGQGGKVDLQNSSLGTVQLLADVIGYFKVIPPDVTAPGPVTALTATAAGTTSIKLAWTNPSAIDFTGVTIRRALGATAPATVTDGTSITVPASRTVRSYTNTGLTSGTQYSYAVFAHDGALNHAAAAKATATTTKVIPPDVTAPGPVTALTATAAGTTSIKLAWTNPSAIDFTGVTIRRALGATAPATLTSGTSVPVPQSATATSYTNTGLTSGTQYSYAVFAHDGALNHAAAAKATATTTKVIPPDVTAPGPVTALTATAAGTTSIKLAWTNPSAIDFTGVTIRRALGATAPATLTSGTSVPVPQSATATSYINTGLTAGTQYSYAVFAHDGALNHAAATKATATTTKVIPPDVTAPGPVTALTATAASDTSIKLDWTNPTAADFTGVTIRRALGATAPTTVTDGTSITVPASATATSYTDTNLTSGTQYSYAVFAHDGALNHAAATKVTATTTNPPDVTAPGPVTALTATAASDTSIKLDWTNPSATDFTGVTIRRALGATAPATVTSGTSVPVPQSGTATSYTDTGLTDGTQYSYAVFAHDGALNHAAAAKVTAATTTGSRPTAVLAVNSSHGLTAKTTVGGYSALFDVSGSLPGSGATLVSALLNYGDGTPPESFSGDPATWISNHDFATVGDKVVTVVVTNSAGTTATDAVTVTVYPMPTATIKATGGPIVPGQPVTFELTSLTPAGTVFTDYDFCFDSATGEIWDYGNGVPPTTMEYTFPTAGLYDVEFYVYNDADGWALASVEVTVNAVDTTPPGPVTALTADVGADSIALAWANPADADFSGVTIRRLEGATAPTLTTGTLVTDTAKAATSFTDTHLTVATQYSYAVFAHDGSGNYAAAAKVTGATLGALPTAVLSINGSTSATAKTSVGGYKPFFDMNGSEPGAGTLVSALLSYGDGTTETFTGADPASWSSEHVYSTSGDMPVTVVVTNSAGDTATAAVLLTVVAAPTAMITPPRIARPGDPVTLALTSSTPAGTEITDYDVSYDNGATWVYVSGAPPTTLTHTFIAEGTYTVLFDVYNDADGWAFSSAQVRVDVTPPAPVTNLMVSVVSLGNTWLSLSWANPTDVDLTGVMIRRQVGATAPATVNDGDLVSDFNDRADYVINPDLTPGTQYSYAVFAHDGSGNYAAGVNVTGTTSGTPPHLTPPGPVTNLTAAAVSDNSIKLSWVNPIDLDFAGVTIRRAEGPTAPASPTTGLAVTVPVSATATSFTDTGLTADTQYSYAVFAYDVAKNHAATSNVTKTTTRSTTAVLVTDTTRTTAGLELFFDPSPSYAATGATLTGTLDYGDGTPPESFSGDPAAWYSFHTYSAAGAMTVTLKVTDSTNKIVTKVVTMNVFDPPTAAIPSTGQAQVGMPFTFPLTATTPSGTAFQSWSLYGDWLAGNYGAAPPATLTHTFTEAGTYSFTFAVTNDAQGEASSSTLVVTVQ